MKIVSKIKKLGLLLSIFAGMSLTHSCTEEIDTSARYTFTGNTLISYLKSYPDVYSEYYTILDSVNISDFSTSTLSQLLSARGCYTCFAPTNEAVQNYLQVLVDNGTISVASWNAPEFQKVDPITNKRVLLEKVRKTIAYNSIFNHGEDIDAYQTSDFDLYRNKELPTLNMRNRSLKIKKDNDTKQFIIEDAPISLTNCNIYTINGRIHQTEGVIAPIEQTLANYFTDVRERKLHGHYVYSILLDTCGLLDELNKYEDENYYNLVMNGTISADYSHPREGKGAVPEHRFYGYTLFLEKDETWEKALGLSTNVTELEAKDIVERVCEYISDKVLPSAESSKDFTKQNNALNQFVTYHMLPAKMGPSKLVKHYNELGYNVDTKVGKNTIVTDYYTTMGKRRLMKIYDTSKNYTEQDIYLNRFPELSNQRQDYYLREVFCEPEKSGVKINTRDCLTPVNGYIYNITDFLYFNDFVSENMGKERIRIEAVTMFKELLSNDIRKFERHKTNKVSVRIPVTSKYPYVEDLEMSDNSYMWYFLDSGSEVWSNHQGDELHCLGNYELTLRLPPVPMDGMYELRIPISANNQRGMCQIYWGTNKNSLPAADIPFDMRMGGKNWETKGGNLVSVVGYEDDVDDDEVNIENDKQMRNKGYMKAPKSIAPGGNSLRQNPRILRRIILRKEMKKDETYYIQFKSVLEDDKTQFFLDYIEYCPKEVYDNPDVPEDIW